MLQNITFAQLDRDDLERIGDQHFLKLFKLSQLSIEYLLYTQSYLESLSKALDLQYKSTFEQCHTTEERIKKYQTESSILKKELKMKQHTLSTFEYIMKMPADEQVRAIFCKRCHRAFREKKYVARHYAKFHAEQSYELDYASDEEREKGQKAGKKEVD